MQLPNSTSSLRRFRALAQHHRKPRRLLRQFLVATLIAALVLFSLPLAGRLTPPAQAQIIVIPPRICDPNNPGAANQIIQKCALGEGGEYTLENSVINDLLSSHKLPQSDRSRLLGWERDAIRAGMYAKLITDIQNGVTQAVPMPALAALVKARRVLAATKALDEYNRWAANCPYTPPGPYFTYLETQCTGLAGLFGRNAPSFEAFQAYGAYLANPELQNNAAMQESAKNMALGISLLSGLVVTGVATGVIVGTGASITALSAFIFPSAAIEGTLATVGVAGLAAPVAAILFAVIVGTIRGIQVAGQSEIPGKLQQAKTEAMNQTIDLAQLITTDNGRREVLNELLQATFPDFPATSGVPAASASDPQFEIKPVGGSFTGTASLQYKDWDGNTHTLRLNGGWFVDQKGSDAERLALSVKFLNTQGRKRQVSRVGSQFLVTDVSDDKAAPIKSVEFEYQHPSGNPYVARVVNTAPTIATFDLTRRQELPAPTTDIIGNPTTHNVAQIATIGDSQDSLDLLQLTVPASNNGITISEIKVQPDGKVMARVQPSCAATNASFNIQVMDTAGVTASATLNVTVTPNAAPVLSYAATQSVTVGGALTVLPTAGPSDDGGNVHKWDTFDSNPFGLGTPTITPLNPTAPAFSGTVTHTTQLGNVIYITPVGPLDIRNAGPVGSYRVDLSMTDACGLTTVGTFILNVTCVPIFWGHGVDQPTCPGASNGQITINAHGGSGALKYSRDNGQTFQDSNVFGGLSAGTYNLVVKDSLGCATVARTITLVDPTAVTFTTIPANPTCNGGSNGKITINASGGTNSFTYSLNGGGFVSSNVFSGLAAGSYQIAVKDSNGCAAAATQTVTLTQPPALSLTPNSLPTAQAGSPFSQSLTASGGTGTKLVSLSGALPNGLSFSPAPDGGTLAGTPLSAGSFPLTLTIIDQNNCTTTQNLTLTVACPTITLAPTSLPNGYAGTAYSTILSATPTGAYSFSVTSGLLPPGLSLNAATGALTGTPTVSGNYAFAITAAGWAGNAGSCTKTQSYNLLITSTCATLTLNPTSLPAGALGTTYTQTVSAAGGTAPYTFSLATGALPSGLTLDAQSGVMSGTPTVTGVFAFTLRATGQGGCTGQRSYVLSISCGTLTFTPAALPSATNNMAYRQQLSVNSAASATFSLLLGSLPAGFVLSSTGLLSGMTSQTGTYNFTVKAVAGNCQGTKAYSLTLGNSTAALAMSGDYDGDGQSDPALRSASDGVWWILHSSNAQVSNQSWGTKGDVSLLGDYDGDGKSDLAVFRPGEATFYVKRSSDGGFLVKQWGLATDVPVPGDYDGDGKTDIAVWRGATGTWYIVRSSDGRYEVVAWGAGYAPYSDVPVAGDFDGDGKSDVAVFRRATGTWMVKRSRDGQYLVKQWGLGTDVPVAADYDGDGQTDIAVWRSGTWYIWQSATDSYRVAEWGTSQAPYYDQAVPGDYDGDGQIDLAVWRPVSASFHLALSSAARDKADRVVSFDQASHQPVGVRLQ